MVIQHPANASVCAGVNTSFTVGVSGTSPLTYQWQESTGGAGGPWNNITNGGIFSGTSTETLILTGVTAGMTGNQYRCIVTGQCAPVATSNAAILTISPMANAGTVSGTSPICIGELTTYNSNGDPGGTWSSDNTSIATVNANTGLVSGVSAGTAAIIYTVNSGCGSPVTASKQIEVSGCGFPTVTCPTNITVGATTGCNVSVTTPNPAITNTTTLTWILTGATTGNSSASGINYVGTRSFNIGVTTITYNAINGAGSATCSYTVTVADNTPAVITCPANITKTLNGKNKCSVSINVPNPVISGNCSVTKVTWAMTGALVLNSSTTGINYVGTKVFPVGVTTITYTITNGAGNSNTCSFTVTVINNRCSGSTLLTDIDQSDKTTDENLSVKVSPNPSNDYFTLRIHSNSNENVEIAIYAINGKLVQKLYGNVFESFRFGHTYIPGTYIVRVKQGIKEIAIQVVR
jgi:uncharacterized protein YjdB